MRTLLRNFWFSNGQFGAHSLGGCKCSTNELDHSQNHARRSEVKNMTLKRIDLTKEATGSKWLSIGEGETVTVTVVDTKIQKPATQRSHPTMRVLNGKDEVMLNLPAVLYRIVKWGIEHKKVKRGTKLRIQNTGKVRGKNYYGFQVDVV